MDYSRILFVCRDNTTLSPLAEALFHNVYEGEPIEIASRGIVVLFESPINPKVDVVLGSHGYDGAKQTTKKLSPGDINKTTLILVMNEREKESLEKDYPGARIEILGKFAGGAEIFDPYGGTLMDYENAFSIMSVAIKKLAIMIKDNKIL